MVSPEVKVFLYSFPKVTEILSIMICTSLKPLDKWKAFFVQKHYCIWNRIFTQIVMATWKNGHHSHNAINPYNSPSPEKGQMTSELDLLHQILKYNINSSNDVCSLKFTYLTVKSTLALYACMWEHVNWISQKILQSEI